uniref:Uncharacterized protein n=1 Tax=Anguilla anguilla TaxID=7936 RepID=A0A0E9VCK6_ANGAN
MAVCKYLNVIYKSMQLCGVDKDCYSVVTLPVGHFLW